MNLPPIVKFFLEIVKLRAHLKNIYSELGLGFFSGIFTLPLNTFKPKTLIINIII